METPLLKIDAIRRCVRRVEDVARRDPSLADQDVQDVVVLNLQRACEQAIDLANWICADRSLGTPRTSAEVFDLLESAKIITPPVALRMRKMVGFRNIAVHEYQRLDPQIVKSIVTKHLPDFAMLIAELGAFLKIKG